jgi:hypothetical protein
MGETEAPARGESRRSTVIPRPNATAPASYSAGTQYPQRIERFSPVELRDNGPNSSLNLGVARLPLLGNFSYSAIFCAILTNFKLNKLLPTRETKE